MGFRDMMNDYFYGKQGMADMTMADLPANRRQLFGEVLKVRWSSLVGINLLYLVAWVPAIVWTGINLITMAMSSNTASVGSILTKEDLPGLISIWLLILVPCIAVTGPFNAGVTYVLRNWARDQHSFVLSDFWDAVKGNWKQALAVSFISGALPFLVYTAYRVYGAMMQNSPVFALLIGLVMLVAILWSLVTMLVYPMMVTYELHLRDLIRNSLLLTLGKLPFALLFKLLTLAVPLIAAGVIVLAPSAEPFALLVTALIYLLFLPAFNKLLTVSYANWLCETYMNTRIEGAQTNIGLRPENWDSIEYRPEDDE